MSLFGKNEDTNKFFNLLNDLAKHTLDSIIELELFLSRKDDLKIQDYVHKKDEMRVILKKIQEINVIIIDDIQNSFITPIDREDIFNISNSFTELARYSYSTIDQLATFQVKITANMIKMINHIKIQTEELNIAVQRLSKNPRVATQHLNLVKTNEEMVERLYRKAIYNLFVDVTPEKLSEKLFKREVYRHIANMSDKAISAAKVLGMIVMKLS